MKRWISIVAISVMATLLVAVPVFAIVYQAPVTVTETNGTDYTRMGITVAGNFDWMADNGFFESDALDTRIETLGGLEKPHLVVDDQVVFVDDVTGNSQSNLYFTTGNTDLTNMDIVPGYDGYVTITDHASLEGATQFLYSLNDVYCINDADGTSHNALVKTDALRICNSDVVDDYMAGYIPANYALETTIDAAGVTPATLSATDWEAQTFTAESSTLLAQVTLYTVLPIDDFILRLRAVDGTGQPTGGDLAITPATATVNGGNTTFTFNCPYWITNDVQYALVWSGTATNGRAEYNNANPYAEGTRWKSADSGATWAQQAGDDFWCSVYDCVGSAKTVTDGEHDLSADCSDGANFYFSVDGSAGTGVAIGVGIPGNANNYVLGSNNFPYMDSFDIYTAIGAYDQKVDYSPNDIISGTTLPNRAAGYVGSFNGAFTWGSNPAGVTATLGSLVAEDQPTPGTSTSRTTKDIAGLAGLSDWAGDGTITKASTLASPVRPFITMVSDATTLSEIQVWRWLGIAVLLFVTVAAARMLKGHRGIAAIIGGCGIGALVAFDPNIYPIWLIVIAIVAFVFGVMSERTPTI